MAAKAPKAQRFVAFLRAINVGGHTVKMDRLRGLFESLGLANVATFIASGNVLFDAPAKEARKLEIQIAGHLQEALGYEVATFLRSAAEVAAAAAYQPFPAAEQGDHPLWVAFLGAPPSEPAHAKLKGLETPLDSFHLHAREMYWLYRSERFSDSKVTGARLERALGMPMTLRNVTTVRKLAAIVAP